MYAAMLAAEAARTAQEIHGTADIDARDDARRHGSAGDDGKRYDGRLGMPGIGPEFAVTCADHGGTGMAIMQQWDGEQWVTLTDFIAPDDSVTQPLVMEDSAQYAAENNISSQCTRADLRPPAAARRRRRRDFAYFWKDEGRGDAP
jgi:branched-chain amino acid transport system substrate-binding protein